MLCYGSPRKLTQIISSQNSESSFARTAVHIPISFPISSASWKAIFNITIRISGLSQLSNWLVLEDYVLVTHICNIFRFLGLKSQKEVTLFLTACNFYNISNDSPFQQGPEERPIREYPYFNTQWSDQFHIKRVTQNFVFKTVIKRTTQIYRTQKTNLTWLETSLKKDKIMTKIPCGVQKLSLHITSCFKWIFPQIQAVKEKQLISANS